MFPMMLMLMAAATVDASPGCPGTTTPELNACGAQSVAAVEREMDRYVAAARKRLQATSAETGSKSPEARALKKFDAAEIAWRGYRDAECAAVYEYWSEGTIRAMAQQACVHRLTQLHTHVIWHEWLTYQDTTPPLLPEPPLPKDE